MRFKPGVDTLGVENVVAFRDQTQRFVVLELVQTDSALERALADLQRLDLGVDEGRERVDDVAVESAQGAAPGAVASGASGADDGVAGVGAVADVDGEEAHEEESRNQHDNYYGERRAEFHVGVGVDCARGFGAALGERGGKRVGEEEEEEEEVGQKGNDPIFRGVG